MAGGTIVKSHRKGVMTIPCRKGIRGLAVHVVTAKKAQILGATDRIDEITIAQAESNRGKPYRCEGFYGESTHLRGYSP